MRTSPPHACTPARPDPRSSNGPAGRRTERGRFLTEPALHFHLQLFPHRPESCSCTSEVITPLSHCMAGSLCPRSCQTSFGTHFVEHSSGSSRILNSSVPATSCASVSEHVKQRSERLTICTALTRCLRRTQATSFTDAGRKKARREACGLLRRALRPCARMLTLRPGAPSLLPQPVFQPRVPSRSRRSCLRRRVGRRRKCRPRIRRRRRVRARGRPRTQ